MILRQFCCRHGRSALSSSTRSLRRAYASQTYQGPTLTSSKPARTPGPRIPSRTIDSSITSDPSPSSAISKLRAVEAKLEALKSSSKSIEASINGHISSRILSLPDDSSTTGSDLKADSAHSADPFLTPYRSIEQLQTHKQNQRKAAREGTHVEFTYDPLSLLRKPMAPAELTLPLLLANQTHLGHHTSLWHPGNSGYIFGIRDGIHIIGLDTTFAHVQRAAKVVQEIARRGGIILFVGTRKGQSEIVVKAAKLAQGYHIFDRWVPGSLTNGQQILGNCAIKVVDVMDQEIPDWAGKLTEAGHPALKPDLVICLNPIENEVCLHECGLHNVPTIGIIDTDVNPTWVTYPIPANDDSLRSVALIAGCLGRAGQAGQKLRMKLARSEGLATYETAFVRKQLEMLQEEATA